MNTLCKLVSFEFNALSFAQLKKTFANDSFNATVFFAPFVAVSDLSGSHHRLLMTLTRRTPLEPAKCSSLKGCPIYGDSHKKTKVRTRTDSVSVYRRRPFNKDIYQKRAVGSYKLRKSLCFTKHRFSVCVCTRDLELTKYAGVS